MMCVRGGKVASFNKFFVKIWYISGELFENSVRNYVRIFVYLSVQFKFKRSVRSLTFDFEFFSFRILR